MHETFTKGRNRPPAYNSETTKEASLRASNGQQRVSENGERRIRHESLSSLTNLGILGKDSSVINVAGKNGRNQLPRHVCVE